MKIHILETDPRFYSDPTFPENHGSFSVICYGINNALKEIGCYSEIDNADWVGLPTSLETAFKYKNKRSFVITVWETINALTNLHLNNYIQSNQTIFGMSDQITNLYKNKYGIPARTLYCGCNTDFYKPTLPKFKQFTFVHVNSSNSRSGLELTLQAFAQAFQNKDVKLIVKDTFENTNILQTRINELNSKYNCQIEYISKRWTKSQIRDLYSQSHVCLNLLRMTSFGFPLLESSACGCLCLTGNAMPTNEIIKENYGILIKPSKEVRISEKLNELVNYWGLSNCYGGFTYQEEPMFYDFDLDEYTNKLLDIYNNWDKYSKIDTRTPIVGNWRWSKTAENLVKYLDSSA